MALPITIIGGYLGTGKTSLVNHLLRHANGLRLAVLVNEFGSLSIDEDLLAPNFDLPSAANSKGVASNATTRPANLISIAGGCVCCSYGNDLSLALLDLLELEPKPDHVLLEASGVALPAAIAASVSLLQGYLMDGIVVLASAETIEDQAADTYIGDTIERQLGAADLMVLNKTDLVAAPALQKTASWLRNSFPGTKVLPAQHGELPPEILMQTFVGREGLAKSQESATLQQQLESRKTSLEGVHDPGLYRTQSYRMNQPVDADKLARSLATDFPAILRVKGFVRVMTEAMKIESRTVQIVGTRWQVSETPEGVAHNLVIIGLSAEFDAHSIQELIQQTRL